MEPPLIGGEFLSEKYDGVRYGGPHIFEGTCCRSLYNRGGVKRREHVDFCAQKNKSQYFTIVAIRSFQEIVTQRK